MGNTSGQGTPGTGGEPCGINGNGRIGRIGGVHGYWRGNFGKGGDGDYARCPGVFGGGGGGAGGWIEAQFNVTPGQQIEIQVGAGGWVEEGNGRQSGKDGMVQILW